MLAPVPTCIECRLPATAPSFSREAGVPVYWSDEGHLCSPRCAAAHYLRRRREGREIREPAGEPKKR